MIRSEPNPEDEYAVGVKTFFIYEERRKKKDDDFVNKKDS
jgi:hypothetical protein